MIDKNRKMSLKPHAYIPLLLLFGLLQFWVTTNFTINVSDSAMPIGIYRVHKVSRVRRGDLIALRMLGKQVAALPGDHVRFAADGVYVNGQWLKNSAPEDGIPHYPFGDYVVPDYLFLGMGTNNPDSFDGRYVGWEPQSQIQGTLSPLW